MGDELATELTELVHGPRYKICLAFGAKRMMVLGSKVGKFKSVTGELIGSHDRCHLRVTPRL